MVVVDGRVAEEAAQKKEELFISSWKRSEPAGLVQPPCRSQQVMDMVTASMS